MTGPETVTVAGHTIHIDREKRRVWVALPLSASMFASHGRLMRLAHEVCGEGAVWVAAASARLGGAVAICARDGAEAWVADLDALRAGGAS